MLPAKESVTLTLTQTVSNRQNDRILMVLQNRQNPVMQSGVKMTLSAGILPDGFKPST
jgi:hypothetical protein